MRLICHLLLVLTACASATMLFAQAPPVMVGAPQVPVSPTANQPPAPRPAAAPAPAQGAPPAPATQPAQPSGQINRLSGSQPFLLGAVSLTEMIDVLAKEMKINYILDPRVVGKVTIYTYGEVKPVELMPLLETLLRVNGATIVKVGEFYRIVPISSISNLPLPPMMNADPKTLPDDERMVMNLIFLKYTTAAEMNKLLTPFYGEGATSTVYEPANLLILQDNARSMKRTMELLATFDSDTFAGQRVRLFDIAHSRPSDLVKELESVFKAYSLTDKGGSVKFLAVDRINTVIAVSPNPRIFEDVQKWIEKLDLPVKVTAGSVSNYVYRLKYGRAETVAMAIMALYSGNPMALMGLAQMGGMGMGGMGFGGMGMGGMGMGGMGMGGMGMGGMGYGGMGMGGMGMGGYPGYSGYPGVSPYAAANMPFNYTLGGGGNPLTAGNPINVPSGANATPMPVGAANDLTGSYMGLAATMGAAPGTRIPHVIPNPFDNTLLVQASPQEWEQISSLLRQLDIAPRQVLIDAKIYELDLKGAFASGVQAYLEKQGVGNRVLNAASNGGATLSVGALVLRSHELMLAVSAAESQEKSRIISSPSIIATDSIPAVMNVGQDVPVLTSSGVAVTGSSFNSVSNRSTGTTLSVMARVNSSGVITMMIDQDVSQPISTSSGSIGSPSFSRRSFSTQVTVQDGDTIAIGGFIQESTGTFSQGVPVLHRIPILGAAFGSKTASKSRTELVVFLTPRVIYDTAQIQDATDEIKSNFKKLQKSIRDQ